MPAVNLLKRVSPHQWFLILAILPFLGGCNIIGVVAGKLPKPDIEASYKGLANQTVGVMVWVDRSTLIDWPSIQLNVANSTDGKLRDAQKAGSEEFKGTQFPYEPASFIKYIREHPGSAETPIAELAPKLGVSRLIYIEVNNFSSRAAGADTLFLGQMDASMKVIEIENGVAKVAYTESNIHAQFPKSATKDGVFNQTDRSIFLNTVNEMSTELAIRFFKHPDPTN